MQAEQEKQSRWSRFKANSKDEYQLVVRDVKSFREVGSYNLTPLNLYIALSSLVFLVAVAAFLIIAFTPLRQYIPGYGDIVQRQEMNEMEAMLTEMGQQL
ncbi:MAG: hypothetical protein AAGA31_13005, partial [Bacteroidota bacterium]